MVIISQCTCVSKHHVVQLEYMQFLFFSYILIKYNKQTINIYYLIVSVGQEFSSGLARGFLFRVSYEVTVKMTAGLQSSGGWDEWSSRIHFQNDSRMYQLLAPHVGPPTGCLSILRIWCLATLRISSPRELGGSHNSFYGQASEVLLVT